MRNKRIEIIWRYGIVSVLITLGALAIIYCAVSTTVIHRDEWNQKADSMLSRVLYVEPSRGEIQACDGTVLATNVTAYTICIDYRSNARKSKEFRLALDSIADSMALYYPQLTKAQWLDTLAHPLVKAPSERKTAHVLLKNATYNDYLRIRNFPFFKNYKKKYTHGLYFTTKEVRVMPYGQMARRSIGRCSYRRSPKFEGAKLRRDCTDVLKGYSGLEYALDSLLYGTPGRGSYVQLTRGVRKWVTEPARKGMTIRTTIDINMQDIVENELHQMLENSRAEWGTALLMEVETGDIKAISNLELYDGKYVEAQNHAVRAYEPGSVMKPISMICALEDGYAFPLDRTMDVGSIFKYAGGPPIHDTHSPAKLEVRRFIEYSSNIGMTKLIAPRYENDVNGFRERLRSLGFLDTLNTGIQGERTPFIPTLDIRSGGRVSLSRMTYGYATQIPPLYTCAMYNAIANDGKFVRPRIIKETIDADGNVNVNPISYVRDSIMSKRNSQILREMIHDVVWGPAGTARTVRSDLVDIAGKTGTCLVAMEKSKEEREKEKLENKDPKPDNDDGASGYIKGRYRLTFCGFFPYDKPKYTCIVLICSPKEKQYNAAAVSSGAVVKNIALKMYARGMLNYHPDFHDEKHSNTHPTLYASAYDIDEGVRSFTGAPNIGKARNPAPSPPGQVPDVKGLGMREAVGRLEDAGYNVRVHGCGYAVKQTPGPGTKKAPGATVDITFSTQPAKAV